MPCKSYCCTSCTLSEILKNALLNWGIQGLPKFLLGIPSGHLGHSYKACKQENKFM